MKTTDKLNGSEINEIVSFQANCLFEEKKYDEVINFMKDNEKYLKI